MNDASGSAPVTYADVAAAAARLEGVAHRTPVATSAQFDALTGAQAFFKCENLQRMGAFKFRGAYNALSTLGAEERRGENREEIARRITERNGATLVPPFDHPAVIAGQGTAAKELLEDVGPLDLLFVCCGGAGLLSGCAIAAHHLSPGIGMIGVEPAAGDDAARSLKTRTLQRVENPQTIADGARTESLGTITFPLVLRHVRDIITVTDAELVAAMSFLWERMKLVVEPTGALATAGVLSKAIDVRDRRVGIILSGGNVDLKAIASLFA